MQSPFFKNALVYSLRANTVDTDTLQKQLEACVFTPCASQDISRSGWLPVTGDQLFLARDNQIILCWQREERILPASVIKHETQKKIDLISLEKGHRPKKSERDALRDEVLHQLTPRAFTRRKSAWLWLDLEQMRIVVEAGTAKMAEDVMSLLRKSVGSLPAVPFALETPFELTATDWIKTQNLPAGFSIGDNLAMSSILEDSGRVSFTKSEIFSDEVLVNLEAGKRVTKVALHHEDRLQFTIDDGLVLSRIKFADELQQQNDDISAEEDLDARFEADFLLFRSEFTSMFNALVAGLGGEAK